MGITADDMLKVVKSQLGASEDSKGRTPYGAWYAKRTGNAAFADAAWCDMFLSWCAHEAGKAKGGADGAEEALTQTGVFAYTPWHAQWLASQGRFGNRPTKGALAFFDWAGSRNVTAIDHIGIVAGVTSSGLLITYEGNVGNRAAKRYRDFRNIVGFGYPHYASAQAPAPPVASAPTKPAETATAPKYPLPSGHVYGIRSQDDTSHWGASAADKRQITLFQKRLAVRGWRLDADGVFGTQTKATVLDFQADKRLKQDGLVGPVTWNAAWTAPIT